MTGADLAKKVKAVITKVKACDQNVYLRVKVNTGGNPAIHVAGTVATTDTLLEPRPVLTVVSLEDVQGSSGALMMGDMVFTTSNSLSNDLIKTGSIVYGTAVCRIIKIMPIIYDGVTVGTDIYVRRVNE